MNKWQVLNKKVLVQSKMFKFYQYHLKHGDKGTEHDFFILDTGDWVNIIPITSDNKIVLVRQYRAGTDEITIEVPGGIIDPNDEDPIVTAKRELEEETAYVTDDFEILGYVNPVPSFITNKCYFVLAKNVEKKGHIHFDPSEYIETFLASFEQVSLMVRSGQIHHSLTLNALLFLQISGYKGFTL
jgi:8-oxo-dGTP pyrophosphatase MutT (NUDIX family)